MQKTIADYCQGRDNNFNLLRFIAASMVIFAHSFTVNGGQDAFVPVLVGTPRWDSGDLGVNIFFVISGFLVTQSFLQRANVWVFLEARFLRILPALFIALVLTVLIVGPLTTTLPLSSYFSEWQTWWYFLLNLSLLETVYILPGVFQNNPVPDSVNGALWTLPKETRLYCAVALIGALGILKNRRIFNIFFILAIIFTFEWPDAFTLLKEEMINMPRLASYFALGSFLYINRDHIPLNAFGVVVFGALITLLYLFGYYSLALGVFGFSLAYTVLWVAYEPRLRIDAFNRIGDYSYGLYIYHYPVQQTIVYFNRDLAALELLALSFVPTLLLAVASWHIVEKRALRLKGKTGFEKIAQRLFASRWERVPIGIEQVNLSGSLLNVNRKLCQLLGYSRDELLQMSFRDITHADDLVQEEKLLAQLVTGKMRSYAIQKRYLHKDGRLIPVRVTSSQVQKSKAGVQYRISIVEEIAHDEADRVFATAHPLLESAVEPTQSRIWRFIHRVMPGHWGGLNEAIERALQESASRRTRNRKATVRAAEEYSTRVP
ncbi:MAG: acyltransferase family protein [Pseudomonadota bacterium]|nr:acyltransferase family protein [Pseudomonadota bacterium]